MDVRNCKECGRLFNYIGGQRLCPACKDKLEEKFAQVVVPDDKLSLAIGKSGQNARLASRLTRYKIDIKTREQASLDGINIRSE